MTIYDITKELLSCPPYPGDRAPQLLKLKSMESADLYNLSELCISVHNSTHIDAPLHFVADGISACEIPLKACVGECSVIEFDGILDYARAHDIIEKSQSRILIKGSAVLTPDAAKTFCDGGAVFFGTEGMSPGAGQDMVEVHTVLLGRGVIVAENLDLSAVAPGEYFLYAPPLKIAGSEGSPCRAILISF